jgi:hypothetical protein
VCAAVLLKQGENPMDEGARHSRYLQFTLWSLLIVTTLSAVILAGLSMFRHRSLETDYLRQFVRPILSAHNASVGTTDDVVVYLSVNEIVPLDTDKGAELMEYLGIEGAYVSTDKPNATAFGDVELTRVASDYAYLKFLDLRYSEVTDEGLKQLVKLQELQRIWLDARQGTAKGLAALSELKQLTHVYLRDGAVSQSDVAALEQAAPNCAIRMWSPQ